MTRSEAIAADLAARANVGAGAIWTPTKWERKVGSLCRLARNTYGNAITDAKGKVSYPDAGFWRDKDRKSKEENKKRMPGHLDWLYWRIYGASGEHPFVEMPKALNDALPSWKRYALAGWPVLEAPAFTFDVYLECKTGRGRPNAEQRRTLRRLELSPGAHGFVVYPHDLDFVRAILGVRE